MYRLIAIALLSAELVSVTNGCYSNTDCKSTYTDVDACYMKATYPEGPSEGFCWGGSWPSSGTCKKKKSLGEKCTNDGGNPDNNNCVTKLCDATTHTCKQRTSGCASFGNCLAIGGEIGLALAEFASPLPGVELWGTKDCDAPEKGTCKGSAQITPGSRDMVITLTSTFGDLLTLTGTASANIPGMIEFDADLLRPDIAVYIPNIEFGLKLEVSLGFAAAAVETSIDQEFILSHEKGRCDDPLDRKGKCKPYIFYEKSLKIGYASVQIEIGFQIVGQVTGKVTATNDFKIAFSVTKDISVDKLGARITKQGLFLIGVEEFTEQLLDLQNAVDITTVGSSEISADFQLRFGPQLYISVNGIKIQGGVDFVFQALAKLTANGEKGCATGSAGLKFGMFMSFQTPPFDLKAGTKAACESIIGDVLELVDTVNEITATRYGEHCQLKMNPCEEEFDLCDEIGTYMGDMMKGITGSDIQINGMDVCTKLFSVETAFALNVNGEKCSDEKVEFEMICDGPQAMTDEAGGCAAEADSNAFKISITAELIVLQVSLYLLYVF